MLLATCGRVRWWEGRSLPLSCCTHCRDLIQSPVVCAVWQLARVYLLCKRVCMYTCCCCTNTLIIIIIITRKAQSYKSRVESRTVETREGLSPRRVVVHYCEHHSHTQSAPQPSLAAAPHSDDSSGLYCPWTGTAITCKRTSHAKHAVLPLTLC